MCIQKNFKYSLRRIFVILIFLVSTNLFAQIQIGTGSSDQKLPIEPFYGYSYSQVIYLASEINASGNITQLKWYFDGSSLSNSNNWTIYLGHTSKNSFSSTSDWISVSSLTQVYSSTFTNPGTSGWLIFDITDWTYNGTDNLVVAVDENASSYNSSSDYFYSSSVSGYRALEYHSDGTNPNPSSPPSGTRRTYVANIIFDGISVSCPNPTSQTVTNIAQTSAQLNWTETGTATTWDIEWGTEGFTQGTGTTINGTTTKPYTLSSGLSGGTSYDWYVRADCGGGNGQSAWVGPNTFTTLAATQTIPFSENWETAAVGSAWNHSEGTYSSLQVNTASKYNGTYGLEQYADGGSYTTPSGLADAYTKAQIGGVNESHTSWNSFSVNLTSATSPSLSFWYSLGRSYSNNYSNFWVQIDAGAGWVDLYSVQPSGSTIAFEKKTFDLSSYVGGIVIIRFFHNGKYDDDYLYLDDISVAEYSCPEPSNQIVSNITNTSVQLNWTETGTATTWDIEWGAAGFTQGTGTTISGTSSKPYTLSGLSSNNTYDWYVRADCGSGSKSSWTGPFTFATTITSFPWTEDFENSGASPYGWQQEYVSGTHNWVFQTGGHSNDNPSLAHGGTYNACFDHVSSGSQTKLISPQLDISGLSNPQLSFWHTQQVYDGDQDELRVYYKTSEAGSWTLIPGAAFTSSISSWTQEIFSLPSASSSYYIAFEGLDDYGYGVCVDDVLIEGASCSTPSSLSTLSITTSSVQLNWTENGTATIWEVEYGVYGFTQGNGTTISSISSKPYNLSGLSSGTKYDWYVRANCGSNNYSNWSAKNTFTTTCVSQTLPWTESFENLGVYGAYELPCCWDADAGNMFTTANTVQSDNREANTGNGYIYTVYDADDWIFTPAFDLIAGTVYEFSFYYVTDGYSGWNDVEVYLGTSQSAAAMTNQIGSTLSNITNTSYQKHTVSFTPITSGTYYIGTYISSDLFVDYLTLDDFELIEGCNTNTPTYTENFSSYLPNCWSEMYGQLETNTSFTDNDSEWREDGYANNGISGSAGINISGTGLNEWLISPSIDLSGGNYQLDYDIALTEYSTSTSGAADSALSADDSVVVVISTDNGSTWSKTNILRVWDNSSEITNEGFHDIIDLSGYSTVVKFGFYVTSSVSNGNTDFFLDNFEVKTIPSCQQIYNQSVNNISQTSAQLNWSEFGTSTSWTIEYKEGADFTPGTSQCDAIYTVNNSPTYFLSGLSSGTNYYWYVKPNCSAGGGDWLGADNFETEPYETVTQCKLTTCSPFLEESGEIRYYDSYSFTVSKTASYDIEGYFYDFIGKVRIYQNSFNPSSANTNKIADQDAYTISGSNDSKSNIEDLSLNAGTTYIMVGTTWMFDYSNPDIGDFDVTIAGAGITSAPNTADYYGIPAEAYFDIPSTDGNTRVADYECEDSNGWTHYYYDNGTTGQANIGHKDDKLLLSVKKNGNNIGSISGGLEVKLAGNSGISHITNPPANYVTSSGGWYVFKRYWTLSPINQPTSNVNVRYYYTDDDFTNLQTTITANGGTAPQDHINTSYFKINEISNNYDPNPANGHSGIPEASNYNSDGCWIYSHGAIASENNWNYSTYSNYHVSEIVLAHFSGGGGGASPNGVDNGSPLPIELQNFKAVCFESYNLIEWMTLSETNAKSFQIERSTTANENNFEIIGNISAAGNSNSIKNYSIIDNYPINEAYYRLRSIDFDGKYQLSKWLYIKRNTDNIELLEIYPNPFKNIINIDFISPEITEARCELYDFTGRKIQTNILKLDKGSQNYKLDSQNIKQGTYYLRIKNKYGVISKRIVKY